MTRAHAMGLRGLTARRGRLAAAFLAAALLFCHGAFGALHQASVWSAEHSDGHHAPTTAPTFTDHQMGHQGGPVAHVNYAAALFVVLLGAALALFFGRSLARSLAVATRSLGRGLEHLSLRPPRGPTLPLLQVFRL